MDLPGRRSQTEPRVEYRAAHSPGAAESRGDSRGADSRGMAETRGESRGGESRGMAETRGGGGVDARSSAAVRRLRRGRLVVRKVDPWAVLKFSLVFYFCMLLIMLLGTAVIFAALRAFGVIASIEKLFRSLELDVTLGGGTVFRWFFLLGIVGTVIASAITVFMAFLYNLIADVVGGIEFLVTERE